MKTLVIVNPHAGGGRALAIWDQIGPSLRQQLGHVVSAITPTLEALAAALEQAHAEGVQRIISIGGDGTNHHVINAIMRHNQQHPSAPLTYATIPAGTGRDWSRGAGTPLDPEQAVTWIANTRLRPVDVGWASLDGKDRYFLNTSSTGITYDVVSRVERSAKGGRTTFIKAILGSLMHYRPVPLRIWVDGRLWWDEPTYLAAFANGRYFGQGLMIAPNAQVDDGLFDVFAAGDMRLPSVLRLLGQLYQGEHIHNRRVAHCRGEHVRVESPRGDLVGIDLDGEGAAAHVIEYRLKPRALLMNT
jgi:YegS/Rv2252/BmrU family lipid kinase